MNCGGFCSGWLKKTFQEIEEKWSQIKSVSDYREKIKHYKKIIFDIRNCYEKGRFSTKELDFFLQILAKTKIPHGMPNKTPSLQHKILKESLALKGFSEPKILSKKNGTILVESGGEICIFDAENKQRIVDHMPSTGSDPRNWLSFVNQGDVYLFNSGRDNEYNVQIRVVEGAGPTVSEKELKHVTNMGQTYFLHTPSGRIVADDVSVLFDNHVANYAIEKTVEPGYYQIKVFDFQIHNKVAFYYILLCKTENPDQNTLVHLDHLDEFEE